MLKDNMFKFWILTTFLINSVRCLQYAFQSHLFQSYEFFVNSNMPSATSEWHEGELAMQQQLKVPKRGNPTFPGLAAHYGMRVMQSSLVALGTLDNEGRPWTTVWGGERAFARPVAEGVLAFNSSVDTRHDPVFRALWDGIDEEGVRQGAINRPHGGEGKGMSGLSIDLETRDRVKLVGTFVAGATVDEGKTVQMAMGVTESLGNCPKYLNKKDIIPNTMTPELVSDKLPLSQAALDLIAAADMFFLSSTNGVTMDTNHRGGSPGFIRVIKNEEDELELIYPECKFIILLHIYQLTSHQSRETDYIKHWATSKSILWLALLFQITTLQMLFTSQAVLRFSLGKKLRRISRGRNLLSKSQSPLPSSSNLAFPSVVPEANIHLITHPFATCFQSTTHTLALLLQKR